MYISNIMHHFILYQALSARERDRLDTMRGTIQEIAVMGEGRETGWIEETEREQATFFLLS